MSTPPNKLYQRLKAIAAARDATDRPSPDFQPNADSVEASIRSKMQPDALEQRFGKRPGSQADTRLQEDLDTANRNLTGFTKKGKK